MSKEGDKVIYKELSYKVIGVLFNVYNDLGYGYQEKYYYKAIECYLKQANLQYNKQAPFKISIKGNVIGRYFIDFIIEDKIVLEIKTGNYFGRRNIEQIKGYLKATGLKLAIIANITSSGVKFFRALNPLNIRK
ncbi:MAG: GxxExxY protein [Patescibacteria group bacterium]|nr:GxxExxY protein [Patescibacteria group bacterium]